MQLGKRVIELIEKINNSILSIDYLHINTVDWDYNISIFKYVLTLPKNTIILGIFDTDANEIEFEVKSEIYDEFTYVYLEKSISCNIAILSPNTTNTTLTVSKHYFVLYPKMPDEYFKPVLEGQTPGIEYTNIDCFVTFECFGNSKQLNSTKDVTLDELMRYYPNIIFANGWITYKYEHDAVISYFQRRIYDAKISQSCELTLYTCMNGVNRYSKELACGEYTYTIPLTKDFLVTETIIDITKGEF